AWTLSWDLKFRYNSIDYQESIQHKWDGRKASVITLFSGYLSCLSLLTRLARVYVPMLCLRAATEPRRCSTGSFDKLSLLHSPSGFIFNRPDEVAHTNQLLNPTQTVESSYLYYP